MKAGDGPIIMVQSFNADIENVWKAITDIDQMRQWYFDNIPSFKAEVGFETRFNVESAGRNFLHLWKVTEVTPLKKITYNWKYDNYPGDSDLTMELSQHENSTTLKLTASVTEDFPDDIPEFKRENCIAGWEYFIKQRLKRYLDKE